MWRGVLPGTRLHNVWRNFHTTCEVAIRKLARPVPEWQVTSEVTGFVRIFCNVFCKSYLNLYGNKSTRWYGTRLLQLNAK